MSRHIDADALIEELQRCSYETWSKGVNRTWWALNNVKDNIVQCIERQPTADVVEVVRCRNCKDYEPHGNGKVGLCKNKKCQGIRYENDFCSYGETEETNE